MRSPSNLRQATRRDLNTIVRAFPRLGSALWLGACCLRTELRGSFLVRVLPLLFLLCLGVPAANSAVDDPVDAWAVVDIVSLAAEVADGFLVINVTTRDPLVDYSDHGWPVIELFLNSDKDLTTGDYRQGSVRGTDYIIECAGDFVLCTLHALPQAPGEEPVSYGLNQIQGASVTAPTSNSLAIRLPKTAVGVESALHLFGIAFLQGNKAILDNRILLGNGDRAPNAGALDTASGEAIVPNLGAPVTASVSLEPDGGQLARALLGVDFRTFGDQFEIALTFGEPIDLASFTALRGGIIVDSDRKLETGQLRMIPPHGMGYDIPSWGGDIDLSFWFDDWQTILFFWLSYGSLYAPIPFGEPCAEASAPDTGVLACTDGSWRIQGSALLISGSLSILDAALQYVDTSTESKVIERRPTDGRVVARIYTVDEATGEEGVFPERGRAWDTGTGLVSEPLEWATQSMVSEQDPLDYAGGGDGFDLIRIDAQIVDDNLVVKGVLSSWSEVDPNAYFEVLLDTDRDITTGERIRNEWAPGKPAIGADYLLKIYAVYMGYWVDYFADLVRPDEIVEAHDAFLFAQPNQLDAPEQEDAFTVTIPLGRLGNPDAVDLFVATRRYGWILSERYDIAPPEPVRLSAASIRPEILVLGNGVAIPDGDATSGDGDGTDFGAVDVATGSAARSFAIHNTGTADLNLSGTASVKITGPHAGDFTVTTQPSATVPAGGSMTFTIRFDPSAVGLRQATVSIANDDADENPYDFAIQGTGAPESHLLTVVRSGPGTVTSSPAGISCGSDCTESYEHGTGVTLTPKAQAGYSFESWSGDCTGSGSCVIQMTADRQVAATFSGDQLTLEEALDFPDTEWTTFGDARWVPQTQHSHTDGDAAQSGALDDLQSSHLQVSVQGPRTLSFYWRVSSEAGFDFLRLFLDEEEQLAISGLVDWEERTVAIPDGEHTLRWTYVKDGSVSEHEDAAWVDAVSLDGPPPPPDEPEMSVEGNGVPIADGDTTPSSSDDTDFGSTGIASGAVKRTFSIRNTGSAALALTGTPRVALVGPHAGDFSVLTQPASPVAVGGSTSFMVRFDPSAAGLRRATVRIANDDADENPYDFAIHGTGEPESYLLTVVRSGPGTVTSSPAGIDCGTDCMESYASGASVTLTATPPKDCDFGGWGGSCAGLEAMCALTMTEDKTASAAFVCPAPAEDLCWECLPNRGGWRAILK